MSIFSARSFSAFVLSVFTFITVAHAASTDMSHDMAMPMENHMAAEIYHGQGVVKKTTANSISIAHKPIVALNWPAMTMTFSLPESGSSPVVKAGDAVDFTFSQQAEGYQLSSVTPTK
ncbi:copper-binding protein [Buttiauxella sp. WJP83]|uniref:copper-binding protein n=1 Tax=Buttiauxella sp. WJP83 TaxID=2986951 RepID=UPI0022DD0D2E|nr:copper-binding protein [Buttiauxella sp. WJP83]WBM69624.1 copper-binding protein [Buttiauxella sp. WJP83]